MRPPRRGHPGRDGHLTPAPLVLTLRLDPVTFALLDGLRRRHFPPARNVVPAHVTLFHALPGNDEPAVLDGVAAAAAATRPVPLRFPGVRFLGKGVAVAVDAPDLLAVRKRLAAVWAADLTPQDRQPYRPHVTIQNKVAPADARALYDELSAGWTATDGRGDGLLLWRYRGGPWELIAGAPFTGGAFADGHDRPLHPAGQPPQRPEAPEPVVAIRAGVPPAPGDERKAGDQPLPGTAAARGPTQGAADEKHFRGD